MCTDTYTAGLVIKELGLLEKYLPTDGGYADVKYDITWSDYSSGGPITNLMLANKLNFGVMGDYPLIVNGAKFQKTESLRTLYVAGTGYNLKGSGNAIVVPVDSDIYALDDLVGKEVSTPVGSAAWGMLLKAMQDNNIPASEYVLKNQSPAVGAANIAAGTIDAHSDFCPWSEIMEYRDTGRKIFDGSETGVPYLHGVVVHEDFAEEYPKVVTAFVMVVYEDGEWIRKDPLRAVTMMEGWSGVEKEVLYLYFSVGGHLTLDPTIKPSWTEALMTGHEVLIAKKSIEVDPAIASAGLPFEIWHSRDGIQTFEDAPAFLTAMAEITVEASKVNATYVYDIDTGLKLFGKTAFWVKSGDDFTTFLRKGEAEEFAAANGGELISFEDAIFGFIPTEG